MRSSSASTICLYVRALWGGNYYYYYLFFSFLVRLSAYFSLPCIDFYRGKGGCSARLGTKGMERKLSVDDCGQHGFAAATSTSKRM